MRKELYLDKFGKMKLIATLEDGILSDLSVETEDNRELTGNIYQGKVVNVLGGMQAAFIACGLERNCYLPLCDVGDVSKYEGAAEFSEQLSLKEGDNLLVQVMKDPRGGKGAKVTTRFSFVGKYLIYMPSVDFIAVSRKIAEDAERANLTERVFRLSEGKGGYVVRTSARFATEKQLRFEVEYLHRLYANVLEKAKTANLGELLYEDTRQPVKAVRDSLGDELAAVVVSDREMYQRLQSLSKLRDDFPEKKIKFYHGERSILREYGISEQLRKLLSPKVPLGNGAYLVLQRTEALTSIDVNTGKFVGTGTLEETVFETNLLAAKEIARQVRIRNVGGIVVVDFIDMLKEEHRFSVVAALESALSTDHARCRVLPMSEIGLVEFTRKRTTNEVTDFFLRPCPYCNGNGEVVNSDVNLLRLRDDITDCIADGYSAVVVELNKTVMERVLSEKLFSEYIGGIWKGKRIYFIPHQSYHESQYVVRGDNAFVLELPNKAQLCY